MPTTSSSACKAAPRIAAAAARRRAAEAARVELLETEALGKALLQEEGATEEERAADVVEARRTRTVRWAVGGLVMAAACALLALVAVQLAVTPDEVALCALLEAPLASLCYDRLLPRALLLALSRAEAKALLDGGGGSHHFHHRKGGSRGGARGAAGGAGRDARAIEAGLGVGAQGGHGAVRARHCATDLEDEMLMKAGCNLPAAGRRSGVGGGAAGNAGAAAAYFSAQREGLRGEDTTPALQREGFCGRTPRRAADGPGSSRRLPPSCSRTMPEPDEALNA